MNQCLSLYCTKQSGAEQTVDIDHGIKPVHEVSLRIGTKCEDLTKILQ